MESGMGNLLIQEAIAGHLFAVIHLIDLGANVNYQNVNCVTPLMAAAQWKRLPVVEFLLAKGASTAPVELATGRTALMYGCLSGSPRCVALLLQAGAEVHVRDSLGMTPLMMAAATGKKRMVEHLLKAGAAVDARDVNGLSALDWAKRWARRTVADYLSSKQRPAQRHDDIRIRGLTCDLGASEACSQEKKR